MPLCRTQPSAIVVVATLRALKYNGGVPKAETAQPNVEAVKAGLCNLAAHVENMKKFGVPVVVAINHFLTDSDEEIAVLENYCRENDVEFALSDVFAKGGEGGVALAEKVVKACEKPANFAPLYDVELPIKEKSTSSPRTSTEQTALFTPPRHSSRLPISKSSDRTNCQSAWQRPSTRCPTTLPSLTSNRIQAQHP